MYDLILKNGTVIDGSGKPPFIADIAVSGGKIARVGRGLSAPAAQTVNAEKRWVTPGFIDVHRHADALVFKRNFGEIEARQGITTTINGNCGLSVAPCPDTAKNQVFPYLKPVIGSVPSECRFETFSEYLECVRNVRLPIHFGMLVGNGTLRSAVKGFEKGRLSAEELKQLHIYLEDALSSGAFGVSAGLVYMPENMYTVEEAVEALAPLRGREIPLVTHIRGEGDLLLASVKEVVSIAESLEIPLHISHYKCVGRHNWGHMLEKATDYIDIKRAQGLRISCDVYPWDAGATQLVQVLPPEFLEGGLEETVKRLQNPVLRAKCRSILEKRQSYFENQIASIGWESILVTSVESAENARFIGKRITEIAAETGKDPYDAAFDLLVEERCSVSMVNFIVCESDIEAILKLPYCNVISDSIYPDSGLYHPRVFGSFPKIFTDYVLKKSVLTPAEAVFKMTGRPASVFSIKNKGLLAEGYDADITVFNPETIACNATYIDSARLATGFDYVLANGVIINDHDMFINGGSGTVLRRT